MPKSDAEHQRARNAKNQRAYQARQRAKLEQVRHAADTVPHELADDMKLIISPGPRGPRMEFDMSPEIQSAIRAHAETYGVTLNEVLFENGLRILRQKPALFKAMRDDLEARREVEHDDRD